LAGKRSEILWRRPDVYEHLRPKDLSHAINEAKRVTKQFIMIRPKPSKDKRKRLHLTVWNRDKWKDFFTDYGLTIIDIGVGDRVDYKNVFLMKVI